MGVSRLTLSYLFLLMAATFQHVQNEDRQILIAAVAMSKTCVTASEVIGAILEPAVQVALISSDISISSLDFTSFETPLFLDRNFTLLGTQDAPEKWPVLDLGNTNSVICLGPGVVLNFSRLVLANWRKSPHFQAPGMDIITVSSNRTISNSDSPNTPPMVLGWNLILIHRTCLPVDIYLSSVLSLLRPPSLPPSNQSARQFPDSPTCENRSSAPAVSRCWPGVGEFCDVGFQAMHLDAYGNPVQSGYIVWLYKAQVKCLTVMSSSCMATYGAVGCYYSMFPRGQALGPLSTQYNETDEPDGGSREAVTGQADNSQEQKQRQRPSSEQSQRQQNRFLLALLVGLLGGGLFLSGLAGVAFFVYRRQRHLRSGADALPSVGRALGAPQRSISGDISMAMQAGAEKNIHPGQDYHGKGKGSGSVLHHLITALKLGGTVVSSQDTTTGAVEGSGSPDAAFVMLEDLGRGQEQQTDGQRHGYKPCYDQGLQSAIPDESNKVGDCMSHERESPREGSVRGCTSATTPQQLPLPPPSPLSLHCLALEVVLDPVTSVTPLRPGVRLEGARMEAEVQLLPVTLGKGAFGKVVKGVYGGEQVAVKLLNSGLIRMTLAEFGAKGAPATGTAAMKAPTTSERAVCDHQEDGGAGARGHVGGGCCDGEGAGAADGFRAFSSGSCHNLKGLAQEVEILARCEHPNIIKLLAASLDPPRVCLVMELMDTSLDRLLYGVVDRILPLDTVLHIGIQVARALAYLHPTVLHRDLKPANVLISQPHSDRPIAKLADFGLSRLLHTVLVTRNPEVGTGPYIAPEAFDVTNTTITDRADVYALGVILWEMLAGTRPWYGQNTVQIAFAIAVNEERLPLHDLPFERCPPKLRALLLSCWEHDPARRPAAAEIVKTLALIQEGLVYGDGARPPLGIEPAAPAATRCI